MSKPQRVVLTSVAGYAITAIGIFGIGLLVVPVESRSNLFWPRMLWTEFLALLIWSSLTAFFRNAVVGREDQKKVMGVLPASQLILIVYAVLSFLLMIVHSQMQESGLGNRMHLMLQIGLAAAVGILFVFLNITSAAAGHGLEKTFASGMSPAELCAAIKEQEERIHGFPRLASSALIEKSLKTLREKIQYGLPTAGTIGASSAYREFGAEVQTVCDELALQDDTDSSECAALQKRINALVRQAGKISSQTIKR